MNFDPKASELSAPVPARRKLIRGAFALPMVAAVHSGSALANSSNMRCLEKQGSVIPPVVTQADLDNFKRVQLAVLSTDGQPATYYVAESELLKLGFTRSSSYIARLPADQFQLFDIATNMEIGAAFSPSALSTGSATSTTSFNATNGPSGKPIGFFVTPGSADVSASGSSITGYNLNSGRFAALRFDADGKLDGVGQASGSGSAMTGSCWSSMMGANPA